MNDVNDQQLRSALDRIWRRGGIPASRWKERTGLTRRDLFVCQRSGFVVSADSDEHWLAVDVEACRRRWSDFAMAERPEYAQLLQFAADGRVHPVSEFSEAFRNGKRLLDYALDAGDLVVIGQCVAGRMFRLGRALPAKRQVPLVGSSDLVDVAHGHESTENAFVDTFAQKDGPEAAGDGCADRVVAGESDRQAAVVAFADELIEHR